MQSRLSITSGKDFATWQATGMRGLRPTVAAARWKTVALAVMLGVVGALRPAAAAEAAVTLSPFVIREDTDTGYSATETLSGTRLRTATADVAAAMTIVTAEFMRDIGATTLNDVVDFMPSTAAYASTDTDLFGSGARTATPFTVRGFRSDSLQTNFFTTFTAIDSYNTSRLTFSRGPNSILFGIGNPGGSVGIETNRGDLRRNLHRLEARADSFGGYRAALDVSRVFVRDRAAVRLDVLRDDRRVAMKPSRDLRDSIFLNTTLVPLKHTTVSVDVEDNRIQQRLPRSFEAFDWVNPWVAAGQPLVARAGTTTPVAGVEFQAANGFPVYIPGLGAMDWSRMALGGRPIYAGVREDQQSFGMNTPYRPVPLDAYVVGDGERVDYRSRNASVLIQQRLAEGVYLEVGARHDRLQRETLAAAGSTGQENFAIKIDANAQLPNGAPNPHAGQPYTEQNPLWSIIPTEVNQFRATLSYEKDFSRVRVFNRGLARVSLAGLYENAANHQYTDIYRQVNETPLPISTPNLNDARNTIRRRVYLTEGVTSFTSDFALFEENGIKAAWAPVNAPSNNFTRTQSYVLAGQVNLLDNLIAMTGGLRRDEAFISETNYVRDSRGLFSDGSHGGTRAVEERSIGRPYSVGAVLHAHRNVSFFYNRSTNFRPGVNSARTIADGFLPPLEGDGFDTGVRLSAPGGKVSFSATYFETQQKNFRDPTLMGRKNSWIIAIWSAIDPSRRPPSGWTDTKDQETRGLEFQVVANPTRKLRVMLNASHNDSFLLDHGAATFAYLAANYPLWESRAATRVTSPDGATVGALVDRIRQEESDDRRIIGIAQTRVFAWQANAVGRYRFDDGTPLKGFSLGAAARWREAPVIGFLRNGTLLDPTRPIRGQATTNLDGWLDYECNVTLGGRKLRWSAQLRVQNVFDDRTLQPWTADDDGTGHARIQTRRTPGARMAALSSTFSF